VAAHAKLAHDIIHAEHCDLVYAVRRRLEVAELGAVDAEARHRLQICIQRLE